jgi:CHAD domain-containing protein
VKARKVKGVDPGAPTADGVARIVAVRLDELSGFMPRAADPAEVAALHDLRIAAKRLRYALELFAPAFGPYAATGAKKAKHLQDLLGEIHDCDVTIPRVEAVLAGLGDDEADKVPGLTALAMHLRTRRDRLFAQFLEDWRTLERKGFRPRLEFALGERPAPTHVMTSRSHDGNGAGPSHDLPSDRSPT